MFFRGQLFHLFALILLVSVANALAPDGGAWFQASIWIAVVHQVYVWFGWRAQLMGKVLTRLWGDRDLFIWKATFLPLLLARPLLILNLAIVDRGTLAMAPWLATTLGLLLLVPVGYTGWSIHRYFGIERAVGGDHFRREIRKLPRVREGAFAWTPNAMYVLAFLGLWSIALLFRSHDALVAALFQHAYIWVHYWTVEEPDMRVLYGE
ncbi:MAG: methyltransferase [Planctomycetota bacterium]